MTSNHGSIRVCSLPVFFFLPCWEPLPENPDTHFSTSCVTLDELIQLSEPVFPCVFQGLKSLILYTSKVFFERERR